VEKIYHKSLKGTVDVLMNQLEMAKANQYTVQVRIDMNIVFSYLFHLAACET
jgi:hypothetical protein